MLQTVLIIITAYRASLLTYSGLKDVKDISVPLPCGFLSLEEDLIIEIKNRIAPAFK